MFKKTNEKFINHLKKKELFSKLRSLQMIFGFLGILYSFVFLLYFYTKIDKYLSFIFIVPLLVGIYLINSTKKEVSCDKDKQEISDL